MNSSHPAPPPPITARAAENGLYLSGCLCVMLAFFGAGTQYPLMALLFWAGAIAVPVVVYRLLRRSVRAAGVQSFAEIWAEGIATFFLGSLIPAALTYVLLRFVFPTFIVDQYNMVVEMFKTMDTPQAEMWVQTLENVRKTSGLPTAADMVANLISINIVAGTALSMLVAVIISVQTRIGNAGKPQNNT